MAGFRTATFDGQDITAASLSFNINGSNTLIAASAGNIIRVYRLMLACATGATTIQFFDGTNALTGVMTITNGTPFILYMDGNPWFTCTRGNAFNATSGSGNQWSGSIYSTTQPV
jgi:hypothetical protein